MYIHTYIHVYILKTYKTQSKLALQEWKRNKIIRNKQYYTTITTYIYIHIHIKHTNNHIEHKTYRQHITNHAKNNSKELEIITRNKNTKILLNINIYIYT